MQRISRSNETGPGGRNSTLTAQLDAASVDHRLTLASLRSRAVTLLYRSILLFFGVSALLYAIALWRMPEDASRQEALDRIHNHYASRCRSLNADSGSDAPSTLGCERQLAAFDYCSARAFTSVDRAKCQAEQSSHEFALSNAETDRIVVDLFPPLMGMMLTISGIICILYFWQRHRLTAGWLDSKRRRGELVPLEDEAAIWQGMCRFTTLSNEDVDSLRENLAHLRLTVADLAHAFEVKPVLWVDVSGKLPGDALTLHVGEANHIIVSRDWIYFACAQEQQIRGKLAHEFGHVVEGDANLFVMFEIVNRSAIAVGWILTLVGFGVLMTLATSLNNMSLFGDLIDDIQPLASVGILGAMGIVYRSYLKFRRAVIEATRSSEFLADFHALERDGADNITEALRHSKTPMFAPRKPRGIRRLLGARLLGNSLPDYDLWNAILTDDPHPAVANRLERLKAICDGAGRVGG